MIASTYTSGWVICGMWPAPGNVTTDALGSNVGDLLNHRRECRGALVPRCKERGTMKRPEPCEVKRKQLRIAGFIQERRCIRDERLLEVGREPIPSAGSKRYRFDELFGGTGIVAGSDAPDHGTDPLAGFVEHRGHGGIVREQREQRRLVRDDPSKEIGALASQPKRDRCAERVSGHPCRPKSPDARSGPRGPRHPRGCCPARVNARFHCGRAGRRSEPEMTPATLERQGPNCGATPKIRARRPEALPRLR